MEQEGRHCVAFATGSKAVGYPDRISFTDADGNQVICRVVFSTGALTDEANGMVELTESLGKSIEGFGDQFRVEWRDGPRPEPAAVPLHGEAVAFKTSVPTLTELILAGVEESEARVIRARERYYSIQRVWPYGPLADAPEEAAPMLMRYMVEEGALEPESAEGQVDTDEGEDEAEVLSGVSHYEKRRTEITTLVSERGGGKSLREIASSHGLESNTSKKSMANAILRHEFPLDHQEIE
tara:strand:- start:2404 stop:3120 length:717 start_codon:yes stop_codon:yes gene_type:complete